ncbi:hypothetical protein HFP72_29365 [Nocardiopsis sp. ARC36]
MTAGDVYDTGVRSFTPASPQREAQWLEAATSERPDERVAAFAVGARGPLDHAALRERSEGLLVRHPELAARCELRGGTVVRRDRADARIDFEIVGTTEGESLDRVLERETARGCSPRGRSHCGCSWCGATASRSSC